jgi:hypothetical protein
LAVATLASPVLVLAVVGCGPDVTMVWVCLNPKTGHEDPSIGDPNHYVGGVFDPCHCYDPCGESLECPIDVDAGTLPPGCHTDAGTGGGGP